MITTLITILLSIMVISGIVFVVRFVNIMCKGIDAGRELRRDDGKYTEKVIGKVLEKTTDAQRVRGLFEFSYTIEWFIIETADGNRRKIRNTKANEIFIAVGDSGEFTLRGETVYGFERGKTVTEKEVVSAYCRKYNAEDSQIATNPNGKIPAWQRVEMEREAAAKAENK